MAQQERIRMRREPTREAPWEQKSAPGPHPGPPPEKVGGVPWPVNNSLLSDMSGVWKPPWEGD